METNPSRRNFIKQVTLSSAGLLATNGAMSSVEDNQLFHSANLKRFNGGQATSVLLPVTLQVDDDAVYLAAGGERIRLSGKLFHIDGAAGVEAKWKVKQTAITSIFLDIEATTTTRVNKVTWMAGEWEKDATRVVHSTNLMDNLLFIRKNNTSFFLSLDFPYSEITENGISYPANAIVNKGKWSAHTLSIGACHMAGSAVGKYDINEIEAASEYVEKRFPMRFERPMFLSCSITNRMTDVRDGRIFYSMYDNPTIALSPDLVKEDLQLCSDLGIEYYQVFEGVFDWPDKIKTGESMMRLRKEAQKLNVKIGDYAVPQGLYCPHFNYYHRKLDKPEWLITDKDGSKSGPECLACADYEKLLTTELVDHNARYRLQLICLDFLNIKPCFASNHGHPEGDVYQQIAALVRILDQLNRLNPDFMIWSNSGNWIELMPKLTWYNQNVYLTDPHIREYSPHLNVLKILGDGRREQMVTVHESHFVPYRTFTNFEYYLAPGSRLSDTKVFEYSFLQGLAVTPNIGFGELRTFLNRIPSKDAAHAINFIKYWLKFIRANFNVWKNIKRVGDAPGVGAAELYAHTNSEGGFLVFVNQNPFARSITFKIGESIGITKGNAFHLTELYPKRCLVAEQPLPFAGMGDEMTFNLPAYSVRIVEVKAAADIPRPALLGLDGSMKKTTNGYQFTLTSPQGSKEKIAVLLPEGQRVASVAARHTAVLPMYTFTAGAEVIEQVDNIGIIEVTFPREKAPRELSEWRVDPGNHKVSLPVDKAGPFMGALVHNAFSENYEVQLTVDVSPASVSDRKMVASKTQKPQGRVLNVKKDVTYSTNFILPFIESYGQDRSHADDVLVELAFAEVDSIQEINATINDNKIEVAYYINPKKKSFGTHYISLAGIKPGEVLLKLFVKYK